MMAKSAADRYQSAAEVHQALGGVIASGSRWSRLFGR
jgi:hypothetical protein